MGMFGPSNDISVAEEVESATNEKSVEEDWGVIMNICDKAGKSSDEAKSYLKAITKRLFNSDPHVGIKAVTLLDACVKNSGKIFHIELASREFENDFIKLMTKAHPTVAKKLRESLKRWAENEFKTDVQLNLIPSLYTKLKNTGYDFSSTEAPVKKSAPLSKDPDVVESQEEEEQILKAIELSLKETGSSPRSSSNPSSSLYPSMNMAAAASGATGSTPAKEPRKVRALYDFEAAEDNELTFGSGEIIFVLDDTDPNWWRGTNQRGEGLFPANFVTSDLSVEPEKFLYEKARKMVQFKETAEVKDLKEEPEEVIEINENKIDRLIHLLHEADPTNPERDTEEMLNLEREVNGMGPLIDTELERVDRKHAQLTQLSADLVEALSLYHTLMREPQFPPVSKVPYGYPVPPPPMAYSGGLPLNMHPSMMSSNAGLPPGHDRPPFMHPGVSQVMSQPFQSLQMTNSSHIPPTGHLPPGPGMPPNLPPHIHQHENPMGHYPAPGMPNYGMPNMGQPNFPPPGSISQTNLQNGSQQPQGPHFVSSSHSTQ